MKKAIIICKGARCSAYVHPIMGASNGAQMENADGGRKIAGARVENCVRIENKNPFARRKSWRLVD